MKKRLLALILALVMVVAILPASVLAAPGDEPGQANLTPGPVTSDDNLVTVEKSAATVDGQPNTYDVTLTVTTKDTVSTTPAQSTDVVLVIDASNSMNNGRKLSSAKSAAQEFSSIVLGAGAAGENRIAVVSYEETSEEECGLSDSYWTVQNAINDIRASGGTNIQAGLKEARDILEDSTADNKVILVLSDGEPTYSFRVQGTAQWTGCYEGRRGHYWTGDIKKGTVQFTGFDYTRVVGSGSAYSLYNGARLTVTCDHGETNTVNYNYYENNGDPTIAEAGYAEGAGCEIYSIYLGGRNDTNAIYTMKGIASGDDHFQTTDDVDELADLFKGIAGEITTPTNAGIVTDPMGDFVELDSSVSFLPGVSVDSEGFTWDVSQTQPTSKPDGSKTYTMTYRVTLDTSALGFTTGVHPLNKTTTFTYQVGSDGHDRTVDFKVPTVYGEAAQYNVTYTFVADDGSQLPYGVTSQKPQDSKAYNGVTVTPATNFNAVEETKADGTKGTWNFVSWAPTSATVNGNDVEFTGYWSFTETAKVNVTYTITSTENPTPVSDMPSNTQVYVGSNVVAGSVPTTTSTSNGEKQGTWSFSGWTTEDNTENVQEDVEFTGYWSFTETAKVNVTYTITSTENPTPVSGMPSNTQVYVGSNVVAGSVPTTTSTSNGDKQGTWSFSGWTTEDNTENVQEDVEFTGYWTFTAFNYGLDVEKTLTKVGNTVITAGSTIPTAQIGEKIVWTITVKNTGDQTLYDVFIKDTMINGAGTVVLSSSAKVTVNANATAKISSLAPDEIVTITATYTVVSADAGMTLNNNVKASDEDLKGHDEDTPEDPVPVVGVPGLSVDKTVVSVGGVAVTNQNRLPSAVVGQLIRYQIVVKNTGNVTLDNVTVSDKLWEKGTEITVNGYKRTLTGSQYTIGSLAPDAAVTITYSYRATLKDSVYGYVKNRVTVTSDDGPTTSDEVTIKVYPIVIPDVPADDTPNWLNTEDHYAYIVGYNDGTVKPNNNITRAEVATIFFRLLTDDARAYYWSTDSGFSDVKPGDWYNNAVSTMVNAGILNGYSDGTFKPNANITRAEFATIAARFLSNSYSLNDRFYDTEGHWAEPYINRAAEVGWINGYNDGSFKPDQAITRAEAVTLVNAVLGREPHEDHLLSRMVTWPDNPKSAWYYEDIQEATNSHDYVWASGNAYEIWTELLENRDWAKLEKEWSNAYSAPGGNVMG